MKIMCANSLLLCVLLSAKPKMIVKQLLIQALHQYVLYQNSLKILLQSLQVNVTPQNVQMIKIATNEFRHATKTDFVKLQNVRITLIPVQIPTCSV
jgi:hypothetical protein